MVFFVNGNKLFIVGPDLDWMKIKNNYQASTKIEIFSLLKTSSLYIYVTCKFFTGNSYKNTKFSENLIITIQKIWIKQIECIFEGEYISGKNESWCQIMICFHYLIKCNY